MATERQLHWLQKEIKFYVSSWENYTISTLLDYHNKQFPNKFMVSIASFKSASIQNDVHWVKYGPI